MDIEMIEAFNTTIRTQAEELGQLRAENTRLREERAALLTERQILIEENDFVFEPDFDLDTVN